MLCNVLCVVCYVLCVVGVDCVLSVACCVVCRELWGAFVFACYVWLWLRLGS